MADKNEVIAIGNVELQDMRFAIDSFEELWDNAVVAVLEADVQLESGRVVHVRRVEDKENETAEYVVEL